MSGNSQRFEPFADVLRRFSLQDVIRHYGHAPAHDHKWKSFDCPFCRNKGKASVYKSRGYELPAFYCHHPDCGGRKPVNQVGYVALAEGLSMEPEPGKKLSPAAERFLKIAGAWQEPSADWKRAEKPPENRVKPAVGAEQTGEFSGEMAAESPVEPEEMAGIWEDAGADGEAPAELAREAEAAEVSEPPVAESAPVAVAAEAAAVEVAATGEPVLADGPEAEAEEAVAAPVNGEPAEAAGAAAGEKDLLVLTVLREFHAAMPFTAEHERQCWEKRGLTPETCRRAGLRSSVPGNRAILEGMLAKWPVAVLLAAGLFVRDGKTRQPKPNAKFCGYGVIGKKAKAQRRDERDKLERGWCNPIVFAYYNPKGVLVGLSPHKDRIEGDVTRVYDPAAAGLANGGTAAKEGAERPALGMITEGEFKALAWAQVCPQYPVLALTGIQQVKNLWPDIEEWMEGRLAPRATVAVVFDNEEKGDPRLESFKPNRWERYDTPVWARLLARTVARAGFDGRVGMLPNEWRDAKGKADWDGALRHLLGGVAEPSAVAADAWAAVGQRFAQVALEAVKEAEAPRAGWFDEEGEREIRKKLRRYDYLPKLPFGDAHEEMLARRLTRFCAEVQADAERVPARFRGMLRAMGEAYRTMKGRYYILKAWSPKVLEAWAAEKERAGHHNDEKYERCCALALAGMPTEVSNFTTRWHYMVRRVNGDHDRLVTLVNVHGDESGRVSVPAECLAAPKDWRKWLRQRGGYSWMTGETELQALNADSDFLLAGRTVIELGSFGYHRASKVWFFADCAITPKGELVKPDKQGVFWVNHGEGWTGYTFRRNAREELVCGEGQEFVMGSPLMHPEVADEGDLSERWQELQQVVHETIGGPDGYIALGMMAAYAAMPELFAAESATPGLWLHGEQSQGKSTFARMMVRIWGFTREVGKPFKGSTAAKLRVALQQYSDLPLWLEEYQPGCEPWQHELLKNIYDRSPGMKMDFGDKARDIQTTVVVTGVASCPDAQVKSRYAHVQVSQHRRMKDHQEWLRRESLRFYQFGRHLLRNRGRFAQLFTGHFRAWREADGMRQADARARMVYGVAYAGYAAASELFAAVTEGGLGHYRRYLEAYCQSAQMETRESVNVNMFWLDVVAAAQAGAFGFSAGEMRRFFEVRVSPVAHPPVARMLSVAGATPEGQQAVAWNSVRLYFLPQLVIETLRAHKRKQGMDVPLNKSDLMAQMKVKSYWVRGKTSDGHRVRFAGSTQAQACWCIDLDHHELGYQPLSDAELAGEIERQRGEAQQTAASFYDDFDDPRCGDLFVLVELLRRKEGQ